MFKQGGTDDHFPTDKAQNMPEVSHLPRNTQYNIVATAGIILHEIRSDSSCF